MSNSATETMRISDHQIAGRPRPDDLATLPTALSASLTAELDGAVAHLNVSVEELLLAALSRTIARTFGDGDVVVDVDGGDRCCTVVLPCLNQRRASATEVLQAADRALAQARRGVEATHVPSTVSFAYLAAVPDTLPSSGHVLELHAYRTDEQMQMDWWYDARRLDRTTVEELTEQFPLALIDVTSDALPPIRKPAHLAMA